jgi:hypothetical protein
MEIVFSVVIWLICAIIGAVMAEKRGRSTVGGFMLGLLLGLIGLAIIAIAGEKRT